LQQNTPLISNQELQNTPSFIIYSSKQKSGSIGTPAKKYLSVALVNGFKNKNHLGMMQLIS
jgi:hypothetical protein